MDWKSFEDKQPERNVLLAVFQYKRKKYLVARFGLFVPPAHQYDHLRKDCAVNAGTYTTGTPRWFSDSGNRLDVDDKDMWCYIDPVTITEVFK